MNVVFNTIVFDPCARVGVGTYVAELIPAMARAFPNDLFYALVDSRCPAIFSQLANIIAVKINVRPQPSVRQIFCQGVIRQQVQSLAAGVYHLMNTAPLGRMPCPTAITIHDLQEYKIRKYSAFRAWYRQLANRHAVRQADLILTVSEHSRRDIIEHLRVDEMKVSVTNLAPSAQFKVVDREAAALAVQREFDVRHFALAVGTNNPGKNLIALVDAFSRIPPAACTHLLLIGPENDGAAALRAAVHAWRMEDRIRMLGYVSDAQLVNLYTASQMLVYPSLYEGFGLPPLEAMACGTPVAASRASSIPEVVGTAASLFDPNDPQDIATVCLELLTDEECRKARIAAGLKRAGLFNWNNTAIQTMTAFREIADAGRFRVS